MGKGELAALNLEAIGRRLLIESMSNIQHSKPLNDSKQMIVVG